MAWIDAATACSVDALTADLTSARIASASMAGSEEDVADGKKVLAVVGEGDGVFLLDARFLTRS